MLVIRDLSSSKDQDPLIQSGLKKRGDKGALKTHNRSFSPTPIVQVALLATPQPAFVFLEYESFSKPECPGFQTLYVCLVVFNEKVPCKNFLHFDATVHRQQLML